MNIDENIRLYHREKQLTLSKSLSSMKAVYLDINFWLGFRDAEKAKGTVTKFTRLLNLAYELVEKKRCFFPIGDTVFTELMKQKDEKSLLKTAEMVDILSQNVALVSDKEREEVEVQIYCYRSGNVDAYDIHDLIWTRPGHLFSTKVPRATVLTDDQNLVLQKAFHDHMWNTVTFKIFIESAIETNKKDFLVHGNFSDVWPKLEAGAANVNRLNKVHSDDHKSFKQVYHAELRGVIDMFIEQSKESFLYSLSVMTGKPIDEWPAEANNELNNMLYYSIDLKRAAPHELPSFKIFAGLHALKRWDKKSVYKANDMFDFRHAQAALPYCDFFFTEKYLAHAIKSGHLKYDKIFNCEVCSNVGEAIKALEGIEQ